MFYLNPIPMTPQAPIAPIMLLIIYRYHLSILHHTQIKIAHIFSLLLKLFPESMNRYQLILG